MINLENKLISNFNRIFRYKQIHLVFHITSYMMLLNREITDKIKNHLIIKYKLPIGHFNSNFED